MAGRCSVEAEMKHIKSFGIIVGLASLGVFLGIGLHLFNTLPVKYGASPVLSVSSKPYPPDAGHFTYAYESFDWMNKNADVIVAGRVMAVGETKWNQDSGEYWEEVFQDDSGYETIISAMPYYEITMSVDRLVADSPGIKEGQLIITVIGFSPLDQQAEASPFHPKNGDEIVAFVRQGEIGWYSGEITYNREAGLETGRKVVMLFMGGPDNSHLLRNENGLYYRPSAKESPFSALEELTAAIPLDELAELIQEKRTAP